MLERLIRQASRHLRQRQICSLWKIPNDLRLTSDAVVFGDPGPCDFIGHTVDGTAILIEAKSTKRSHLAVPNKRGIKGHQWIALRDAAAAGAHSMIIWKHGEEVAVLSFAHACLLLGSRRSIPWPGGLSLQTDEPALVIVDAIIKVIDLGYQTVNGLGVVI